MIEEILESLHDEPVRERSKLAKYRPALLEMKRKYFSQREMCSYLEEFGLKVSQTTLSAYLRKYPIAANEFQKAQSPPPPKKSKQTKKLNKTKGKDELDLESWKNTDIGGSTDTERKFTVDLNKPF